MASAAGRSLVGGHLVAYRTAGQGPALVAINNNRYPRAGQPAPKEGALLRLLSHRWRVFQIDPIGFGFSDRPVPHPAVPVADQVCAVLDRQGVDRFLVWGASQCGAMAMTVGRATSRVAGLITFGMGLIDKPPERRMRDLERMDRLQLGRPADRAFWRYFFSFDWLDELATMDHPRLLCWGSEDRNHAPALRRASARLPLAAVDFVEFPGSGHGVPAELAVPRVLDWVRDRVGPPWSIEPHPG